MTTSAAPATGAERIFDGSGGRRWRIGALPDLAPFAGAEWPPVISLLLARRGVQTLDEATDYLGEPGELTDPALMPNLDIAVDRLAAACRDGETVAIFGDFDVDGITSTTILTEGLRDLGARPLPYVPHRFTEGYGPNTNAIRELHSQGATLLVTADCGTSAVDEVAAANDLGMQVIVIDHHTIPDELPAALALVNPKLTGDEHGPGYGSEPAACGVAYKVVHDLYDRLGKSYDPEPHRALVALGTVCDLAPMLAENRDLVRLGIGSLRRTKRPGLRALAEAAKASLDDADPEMCGWVFGPRLNAAGRMTHARTALELLLTDSRERAVELAGELEQLNRRRREDTTAALEHIHEVVSEEQLERALIVAATPGISSGIVGLVASRLAERHNRPAIVAQIDGDVARASCRSIPAFDITALLRRHADLFERFGGHRAAAGFTVRAERLPELEERLVADAAERLDLRELAPTIELDAELPLEQIEGGLIRWLGRVGPHGIGNSTPTFLAREVQIRDSRVVGGDATHLQFTLKAGRVTWRAISFGNAVHAVPDGDLADIVYTLRRDDLRNTLQLEVLDLRPATA